MMNEATDYVHDAIVNYEPLYLDYKVACDGLAANEISTHQARDIVLDSLHAHYRDAQLTYDQIDDPDLDVISMLLWETDLG